MAYSALKEKLRTERKELREAADALVRKAANASREMTPKEQAAFDAAVAAADERSASLRSLPKDSTVRVKRESKTYEARGEHSYFRDLMTVGMSRLGNIGLHDPVAAERRLQRSNAEVRVDHETRSRVFAKMVASRGAVFLGHDGMPISARDLSNASGTGGEFLPPVHVVDRWASTVKGAATFLALTDKIPLPPDCFEVFLPSWTSWTAGGAPQTGGGVIVQPNENLNQATVSATSQDNPSPVETATQVLYTSQAILDRTAGPGLDAIVATDAGEAFSAQAELSLIQGSGANGQVQGVVGAPGVAAASTTATATAPFVQALASAASQVGANRLRAAQAIVATPQRIAWVLGHADGAGNEPTSRPGTGWQNDPDADAESQVFGPVAGLPAYASAAAQVGSTESVLVGRPKDVLTMVSDPVFTVMEEPLAAQLGVAIVGHVYFASIIRHPSGFTVVTASAPVAF